MGLSKRERIIVLVTLLAVGALVGDRLVLAPITNGLGELRAERQKSLAQVAKAKNLLQQKQQIEQKKAAVRGSAQRRGGGKRGRQGAGQVGRRCPADALVRQAGPDGQWRQGTEGDSLRDRRQGLARRRGVVPLPGGDFGTADQGQAHAARLDERGRRQACRWSCASRPCIWRPTKSHARASKQPQPKQPEKTNEEQLL